jgi:DNA polymerase III sliding clamp (beta) subunit (PCNA family)
MVRRSNMEVNREDLLDVLNLVRPGLSQKEIVEQSNHFIFNKDEILAYNDELLISYPFDIELQCTVDASLFLKLISRMNSETVSIELKKDRLEVWNAKTSAHIPIVKESEIFEYITKVTNGLADADWHRLSQDFIDGLRLCAFSAETDRVLGTLTCVRVEGEDIMSGSKIRVSWYKMDKKVDEDFYIEAALIQELYKYEDISSYTLSKAWAHFKSESGVTFSARRVIPLDLLPFREPFEGFPTGVRIKIPADLRSSIETVNIVNEGETGADKLVMLVIDNDKITCKAETTKGAIFEEVSFGKPVELDKTIQLTIRPDFLIDVLEKATYMYFSDRMILFKRQAFQHAACLIEV